MFDLDKEIQSWRRSIGARGFISESRIAELEDHLRSEFEKLLAEGLSQQQAFRAAAERLGNVDELRREYAKNRTLASALRELFSNQFTMRATGKENLLPTITMSVGMLIGGALGAAGGVFAGFEGAVVAGYILGFIAGAVAGAVAGAKIGRRIQARRRQDLQDLQ